MTITPWFKINWSCDAMEKNRIKNFNLRSEEVQDIISEVPGWLIRNGIILVLVIISCLLLGAYLFKYPDIIYSRVTIISENPPISIVSKINGNLDQLFVKDNQHVDEGDLIAVMENPANYVHISKVKQLLDSLQPVISDPNGFNYNTLNRNFDLGSVFNYYSLFITTHEDYVRFLNFDNRGKKISTLKIHKNDFQKYFRTLVSKSAVLKEDLKLAKKQFKRDSILYSSKTIADVEFERSQSQFLKQQYSYSNSLSELANTQIQVNQLEQQIQELETQKLEEKSRLLAAYRQAYENLKTQLITWEQLHLLKAPISGTVSFTNVFSANQYINANNAVFTIVPELESSIIGKVMLPMSGSGKVQSGQKVNIKLDNFPYAEYGIVRGVIQNVSLTPFTNSSGVFYTATLILPNGLNTSHNKTLPLTQEVQGSAEIITKDRRLIERFIEPIVTVFRDK